jgi:tripartite-type tricarboxylate transporter receptor subunit TctC
MHEFPLYKRGVAVPAVALANIAAAVAVPIPGVGDTLRVVNLSAVDILLTSGNSTVKVDALDMVIRAGSEPQVFSIRPSDTHVSASSSGAAANPGLTVWRG